MEREVNLQRNMYSRIALCVLAPVLLLLLVAISATGAPAAPVVYVRTDGSDTACNGTANAPATSAPDCAFATIQKGAGDVDAGGTVNVAAGTYTSALHITQTVTLRGAQSGVDARTRAGVPASESILTNTVNVQADNVVIDGFTIQGVDGVGVGDYGTGLYLYKAYSGYQILNNIIQDNVFGLYMHSSGATQSIIRHNLFQSNNRTGSGSGQGIYTDQGVENVLVDANRFSGHAIADVDFSSTTPGAQSNITFTNNAFESSYMAFIILHLSSSAIMSNTISGTTWAESGAIRLYGAVDGLDIIGNTLVDNAGQAVRIGGGYGANQNMNIQFNRIAGNGGGVTIIGSGGYVGILNAENNWWGCNTGPGTAGCDAISGSIDANPWLTFRVSADPATIFVGGSSTLTADMTLNSNAQDTSALGHIPDGTSVAFGGTLGTVGPASAATTGGKAQTTYTAGGTPGTASITASLDILVSTTLTVTPKLASTTVLTSSHQASVYGQPVVFTATVSASPPETLIPSGSVTFKDGSTIIGTAPLDGTGRAVLTTAQLGVSAHTTTAEYSGDGAFDPSSSSAVPLTVEKAGTVTSITSVVPSPSKAGQEVTIQFQVSAIAPGAGTPTGTVTVSGGGHDCSGSLAGGTGWCTITFTEVETVTLTADYPGDANFTSSSGGDLHVVEKYEIYLPLVLRAWIEGD
jgi:parallel beta-helix repeat protein